MDKDFVRTSIGSYRHRMMGADERAIRAIREGSYTVALLALAEAMQYKACIEELELQIEVSEVNGDD